MRPKEFALANSTDIILFWFGNSRCILTHFPGKNQLMLCPGRSELLVKSASGGWLNGLVHSVSHSNRNMTVWPFLGVKPEVLDNSGASSWGIVKPHWSPLPFTLNLSTLLFWPSHTETSFWSSHLISSQGHAPIALSFATCLNPRVSLKPLILGLCWNKWCFGGRLAHKRVMAKAISGFGVCFRGWKASPESWFTQRRILDDKRKAIGFVPCVF